MNERTLGHNFLMTNQRDKIAKNYHLKSKFLSFGSSSLEKSVVAYSIEFGIQI